MDIPIKRYKLVQKGTVVFMKETSPSRVSFHLTCVKCHNANAVEIDWEGGADRFKKTTTCGGDGCLESLSIWEIPHRLTSVTPVIAIKGHFNLKKRIVDTDITWEGRFYDHVVDFHTTGDGNGSIPEVEAKFNDLVASELNRIEQEYIVGNGSEDSSGSDHSSEVSSKNEDEDEEDADEEEDEDEKDADEGAYGGEDEEDADEEEDIDEEDAADEGDYAVEDADEDEEDADKGDDAGEDEEVADEEEDEDEEDAYEGLDAGEDEEDAGEKEDEKDEEDADEGGAITGLYKNWRHNYMNENWEDIELEKMRRKDERKQKRKEMRAKKREEGLGLQNDVREAMPFPIELVLLVQEI